MDRMIAAFATARIPKALEAWATRKRGPGPVLSDEERLRARDRAIAMLGAMVPGRVIDRRA